MPAPNDDAPSSSFFGHGAVKSLMAMARMIMTIVVSSSSQKQEELTPSTSTAAAKSNGASYPPRRVPPSKKGVSNGDSSSPDDDDSSTAVPEEDLLPDVDDPRTPPPVPSRRRRRTTVTTVDQSIIYSPQRSVDRTFKRMLSQLHFKPGIEEFGINYPDHDTRSLKWRGEAEAGRGDARPRRCRCDDFDGDTPRLQKKKRRVSKKNHLDADDG